MFCRLLFTHMIWGIWIMLVTINIIPIYISAPAAMIAGWNFRKIMEWAINAKNIHSEK